MDTSDRHAGSPSLTGLPPFPLRQFDPQPGVIDLGWGHPSPDLLPVEGLGRASARVFDKYGPDALNYGYRGGPGPLIEWICQRLGAVDRRPPIPESVVVSAGNSHALGQLATLLTAPGDIVLVEAPTYHLAVRIFRDHGVRLTSVPTDDHGLQVDALATIVSRLRRRGRTVRLLYTIPTFHNPTGVTLSEPRRQQLVAFADSARMLIIEDDAYRELAYDGPAPPSLWSIGRPGTVARLGSFAKSLAPGLRTGFITSDPTLSRRIRDSGVLASGGGISHFSSLLVAEFAATGEYRRNVDLLCQAYTKRRDALLSAMSDQLDGLATWSRPAGGYFTWLTLMHEVDAAALLPQARADGVSYLPGGTFYLRHAQGRHSLRLAFSRQATGELTEAVRRLRGTLERSQT